MNSYNFYPRKAIPGLFIPGILLALIVPAGYFTMSPCLPQIHLPNSRQLNKGFGLCTILRSVSYHSKVLMVYFWEVKINEILKRYLSQILIKGNLFESNPGSYAIC